MTEQDIDRIDAAAAEAEAGWPARLWPVLSTAVPVGPPHRYVVGGFPLADELTEQQARFVCAVSPKAVRELARLARIGLTFDRLGRVNPAMFQGLRDAAAAAHEASRGEA